MIKFVLAITLAHAVSVSADAADYISGSETVAIGSASIGIGIAGMHVKKIPPGRKPLIRGHLPFEQGFQRWLGGNPKLQKNNFLDTEFGGFVTPIASGVALAIVNVRYPRDSRGKDAAQDLFLFSSGAIATKGLTDIAKGVFARERPFRRLLGDSLIAESRYGHSYLQHSFFSGHASGAFFSAGFLNLRLRETMRRRMTASEYESWKWVSSGLLYGWASFVGLSRVHAYKHNLSDVVVGAVAGVLVSELFFNLGKESNRLTSGASPLRIQLTFSL